MRSARFPPPVGPGARVGVAALSGAVDPIRLEAGLEALRELGFEPVEANNLRQRDAIFAGNDDQRLEALHQLADDPTLGAIVFARGGHGLLRLLPRLDWDRLGRIPRAWVGYSDVTPFLLGLATRARLVSFHGPMVAADLARGLDEPEVSSLLGALAGHPSPIPVGGFLRAGFARGVLATGCLSLFCGCIGTPWLPSLRGTLLLLEDVGEPLYRVDRMLTHLRLSGSLQGASGFAFGHLDGSDTEGWSTSWLAARALELGSPTTPIAYGLPFGHSAPNLTIAVGATAALDPERCQLVTSPARRSRRSDG